MVSVRRSQVLGGVSLALLSAAVLVPVSMTIAAETVGAETVTATVAAPMAFSELPLLAPPAPILASAAIPAGGTAATPVRSASLDEADIDAETLCMAKVVHHEAGNQSHEGQLAVAQTILNRVGARQFANSVCGVVHQRNQYFDTTRYHPRRDSAAWSNAVAVAIEARSGKADAIAPGALFFRAGYAAPSSFFRTRTRVATVGDHVFYR